MQTCTLFCHTHFGCWGGAAAWVGGEVVVLHACDVLLDDGLDLPLHAWQLGEAVALWEQVVL